MAVFILCNNLSTHALSSNTGWTPKVKYWHNLRGLQVALHQIVSEIPFTASGVSTLDFRLPPILYLTWSCPTVILQSWIFLVLFFYIWWKAHIVFKNHYLLKAFTSERSYALPGSCVPDVYLASPQKRPSKSHNELTHVTIHIQLWLESISSNCNCPATYHYLLGRNGLINRMLSIRQLVYRRKDKDC